MKLTLDVEHTTTKRDGKTHLDPFEPTNSLTMVGVLTDTGVCQTISFDHSEGGTPRGFEIVQGFLDYATVLIMHNAAHDLMWLWESGFKYDGPVFDTMLAEYVLQRGQKEPLSLEACAERYDLTTKKQDTLKNYFAQGFSTRDVPYNELCEYLIADLEATQELSDLLYRKLNTPEHSGLMPTVLLSNRVCRALTRIYCNGFKVDRAALEQVTEEFTTEKELLERELQEDVRELMGDTPINLNSPEQLSQI